MGSEEKKNPDDEMLTASRLRRVSAQHRNHRHKRRFDLQADSSRYGESGEQVAADVNRKGELLSVLTVKTADVPDALSLDHELEAKYTDYLRDLKTGEALIMMTTEGSNHVGVYKLPPDRCTKIRLFRSPFTLLR